MGEKRPRPDDPTSDEEARVEATEQRLGRLKEAVAQGHDAQWKEALAEVKAATAVSDAANAEASGKLAVERYGSCHADAFFPEPPAVSLLIRYSTRSKADEQVAARIDEISKYVTATKKPIIDLIQLAKTNGQTDETRRLGKMINALGKATKEAQAIDKCVGARISTAIRRLASWRASCKVRPVYDKALQDIVRLTPDKEGYTAVCDYYRLTDSAKYSFGRQIEGPQQFVDIRRNVALLVVWRVTDAKEERVYASYAVSGVESPGASLPQAHVEKPFFASRDCEDGLGESYDRNYDAEYKLVSDFVDSVPDALSASFRAVLWSKKPLCLSCSDVLLQQIPSKLPNISLEVVIDDTYADSDRSSA